MSSSRHDSVSLASTEEDVDNWSGSDDESLYDDFDKLELKHAQIESAANTTALSGRRIYALNPYEIAKVVDHDSKIESEFFSYISSVHSLLFMCDKAVGIFHTVNSKALGRTEAADGASTGLELARKSSSTVNDDQNKNAGPTKNERKVGTDGFNVKKVILTALRNNLDKCAEQVQRLDSTIKCLLQSDKLKQIQTDLGWNALDEITSDTLNELDSLEKKQREKHVEIKCQLDMMTNYSNLISATQKQLPHSHSNVEAKESRLKALGKINLETKEAIAGVPASASSYEYFQWLHWWTTKEYYEKNANHKGTEETAYYDSLVYVRKKGMARSAPGGRVDKTDVKLNEKIKKDMTESYNVYNSKYKKAKAELGAMTGTFKSAMGKYRFKIGGLIKKLAKMPELNWMLIGEFACIETFVKSIENRNGKDGSAFYSLYAILSGIETLISTDVELLSSDEKLDIFVAGKRLRKDAAFLLNFAEDLTYL